MWVATTEASWFAATVRYSGSVKPLMSLPTTAPAVHAASSTDARQVSQEIGTSKRARTASMDGMTRSSSSAS